jgi:hypothetical protein
MGEAVHDRLTRGLDGAHRDGGAFVADGSGGVWRVDAHRWSVAAGGEIFDHSIELAEQEQLAISTVDPEGLALAPEQVWFDKPSPDRCRLRFIVSLGAPDHAAFEQMYSRVSAGH